MCHRQRTRKCPLRNRLSNNFIFVSLQSLQPRVQSDGSDGNQGSVKSSSPKYDQVLKVLAAMHAAIFE